MGFVDSKKSILPSKIVAYQICYWCESSLCVFPRTFSIICPSSHFDLKQDMSSFISEHSVLLYQNKCTLSISQAVNSVECVYLCCTILHVGHGWEMTHTHTHTHTQAETSLLYVCWEQVTGALRQYSMEWKMSGGADCCYESCCFMCIIQK